MPPLSIVGFVQQMMPAMIPAAAPEPASPLRFAASLPPGTAVLSVQFTTPRAAFLNPAAPGYQVQFARLTELQADRRPAYVRVTPQGVIDAVEEPLVGRVVELVEGPDGWEVVIDTSALVLTLPRARDVQPFVHLARRAAETDELLAIVTRGESSEIADLVVAGPEFTALYPILAERPTTLVDDIIDTLTPADGVLAFRLFGDLLGKSCDATACVPGCVPFLYPRDGCHSRAHAMCDMLKSRGVIAAKIWRFGRLPVETVNHPDCHLMWSVHVAPVLRVGQTRDLLVLDPALFTRPEPRPVWEDAMPDPKATSLLTYPDIFLMTAPGGGRREAPPKSGVTENERWLRMYRTRLREMSPPPPYRHCICAGNVSERRASAWPTGG